MVKLRFPQNLRFFLFFIVYLAAPSPVWHITYTACCVTAAWCYCSAAGAAQSRPVLQSGDLPPATTSDQHQSAGEPQKLLPSTLSFSLKTLLLVFQRFFLKPDCACCCCRQASQFPLFKHPVISQLRSCTTLLNTLTCLPAHKQAKNFNNLTSPKVCLLPI